MNKKVFESKEEKEAYIIVGLGDAAQCVGTKAPTDPKDRQTGYFGKRQKLLYPGTLKNISNSA